MPWDTVRKTVDERARQAGQSMLFLVLGLGQLGVALARLYPSSY